MQHSSCLLRMIIVNIAIFPYHEQNVALRDGRVTWGVLTVPRPVGFKLWGVFYSSSLVVWVERQSRLAAMPVYSL